MTRRLVTLTVLIGVVALMLSGCVPSPAALRKGPTTREQSSSPSTSPPSLVQRSALDPGSRVTIVGDSIVRGLGVGSQQAWPALVGDDLGWTVTNLGCDGGGFIETGDCDAAIGDRAQEIAATAPDAIVLIASSNDLNWPTETVNKAILPAVRAIAEAVPSAKLIALDSVWGPHSRPEDLDAYDATLAASVTASGGTALQYPDPLQVDGLLGEDGVHPTVAGQLALADAFVVASEKAGLADVVPHSQWATSTPF
ncbi:SGNH/GDSL hydrolase family protein [Rathayibacter toxicus]|uniref:SGNH/GDSL hydrolase family protein n=1 Tax=Rathayibacter toxicus TaxID=145458 RepID=UPI001C057305|nr:SGNH/GDSL hydrolase family protein [Rathayibacter toxicus]QWL30335.1 SGNH/GDSL hydrolase family protein [Rathayibacter toxicus]